MSFITFIYRIGKSKRTYYGKYVFDCISDDHEGLDNQIIYHLIYGINKFRIKNGLEILSKKVNIGVLSFSSNKYIHMESSDKEIKCFDFYYVKYDNKSNYYVNGELIVYSI